jgi:hypothetical protein
MKMYHPRNISAIKKYTVWIPACFNCQNISHISPSYSWQMLRYNKPASINMKIMVFWNMRFSLYYRYQCFRGASCLHFQDKNSLLSWKRRRKVSLRLYSTRFQTTRSYYLPQCEPHIPSTCSQTHLNLHLHHLHSGTRPTCGSCAKSLSHKGLHQAGPSSANALATCSGSPVQMVTGYPKVLHGPFQSLYKNPKIMS